MPLVGRDRSRVGFRLDRDQLEIRPVGKAGECHLGGVIRMGPAVFVLQAGRLKGATHRAQVATGHCHVIHLKFGSYHRQPYH
jgi:hypothetical protein